jgi:hypothetical protein
MLSGIFVVHIVPQLYGRGSCGDDPSKPRALWRGSQKGIRYRSRVASPSLILELRGSRFLGSSYPVSCINLVLTRHNPSLDPRYKNRSRPLATRLDGYTGPWMRSHPTGARSTLDNLERTLPRGTPSTSSSRISAVQGDRKLLQPVQLLQELRPRVNLRKPVCSSRGWDYWMSQPLEGG